MVLFNYAVREITAKIVYYGPGLGGKTTNLQRIHESLDPKSRGKLISLATDADRTLFFDFLPLDLGKIGGYRLRYQLYTVPGQVHYNATRKLVLKGVDAVVFVADSQIEMIERNRESYDNLKENLTENGYDADKIPIVYQFNKQDLPNVATPEEIAASLGIDISKIFYFETVATEGKGVFECLKAIIKDSVARLRRQFEEGRIIESEEEEKMEAAAAGRKEDEKTAEEREPVSERREAVAEPSERPEEAPVEEAGAPEGMEEPEEEFVLSGGAADAGEEPTMEAEEVAVEEAGAPEGMEEPEEEFVLSEEEAVGMEVKAVPPEDEAALEEEEKVTEGAVDMNEVDLETMLNEEVPEKEPEVEVVSLDEGMEELGEVEEEMPSQPSVEAKVSGEAEVSETDELTAVDLSSREEKKTPEAAPAGPDTSEEVFEGTEEASFGEIAISPESEDELAETESVSAGVENLTEEKTGIDGSIEETAVKGGLEDFQAISAENIEGQSETEQTNESRPVEQKERIEYSLNAEAPYQEKITETSGLGMEKPSIEQLTNDLDSVRMKTEGLEKSLLEIKESLDENRELMNKVIDIAMGKVIGKSADQTGLEKSSPKRAGKKRRGFFSRHFGGGRKE